MRQKIRKDERRVMERDPCDGKLGRKRERRRKGRGEKENKR